METNIVPFAFDDQLIRVFTDESGDPWFVAKDVCKALGIEWKGPGNLGYLEDDEKGVASISTPGGPQEMTTISESGLYALVFRSRKPVARAFSKWVRSEVLPSLRKSGHYEMPGFGLPEASLGLRPALRERVLNDAVQIAKMYGATSQAEFERVYARCCILVSGRQALAAASGPGGQIREYIKTRLSEAAGQNLSASRIYGEFKNWWLSHSQGPAPSMKFFGTIMRQYFRAMKKAGYYVYCDCAFC